MNQPSDSPQILLVGHCVPDAYALRMALGRVAPDCEIVFVNDDAALDERKDQDIMLINRILDGRFSTQSGLDLIASLPEEQRSRAALITNLPDPRAKADELGAGPGFGKSQMNGPQARTSVLTLLGRTAQI